MKKAKEFDIIDTFLKNINISNKDYIDMTFIQDVYPDGRQEYSTLRFKHVLKHNLINMKLPIGATLVGFTDELKEIKKKKCMEYKLLFAGGNADEFMTTIEITSEDLEKID